MCVCVCVCVAPVFPLIYSTFIPLSCYWLWTFLLVSRSACFLPILSVFYFFFFILDYLFHLPPFFLFSLILSFISIVWSILLSCANFPFGMVTGFFSSYWICLFHSFFFFYSMFLLRCSFYLIILREILFWC